MSVGIFTKEQMLQERPAHQASRRLSAMLLAAGLAVWVVDNKILKLKTSESWASIKFRFRPPNPSMPIVVSVLNPPTYHTMNFQNYPESDRVTVFPNHRAFMR